MPRSRVYTDKGLPRVPCAHCGEPAAEQWSLRPCAIGRALWYPLCLGCDIAVNRMIIEFLRVPGGEALLAAYVERKTGPS